MQHASASRLGAIEYTRQRISKIVETFLNTTSIATLVSHTSKSKTILHMSNSPPLYTEEKSNIGGGSSTTWV